MVKKRLLWSLFIIVALALIYMGFSSLKYKGTQSTEIWDEKIPYTKENTPKLIKKEGKDFNILLLSDTQLECNPLRDKKTLNIIESLVNENNIDLIMTTGDNVSWTYGDLLTKKFIRKMEGYNIPWGVTLGNHDSEGRGDRLWIGNRYEEAKNSLFKMGPSNIHGVGNYSINIEDEKGNLLTTLIMLDSNVDRLYEGKGEGSDFIYYDQIKWYEWLVKGINKEEGRIVNSLLIFHIPLPEFKEAFEREEAKGVENKEIQEEICSPYVNTGLFEVVKSLGSTKDIFVGHDHLNSGSINYKGVNLHYGVKTGPTTSSDPNREGAIIINIKDGENGIEVRHIYK